MIKAETRNEALAREKERFRVHAALAEEVDRLRAQNAELRWALNRVLTSAKPHPVDNPAMYLAWSEAETAIRRAEEGK